MFEYILTSERKYRLVKSGDRATPSRNNNDINDVHALFNVINEDAATLIAHGCYKKIEANQAINELISNELHIIQASQVNLATFNRLLASSALPGHLIRSLSNSVINV